MPESMTGLMMMGGIAGGAPFGPATRPAKKDDIIVDGANELMTTPCARTVFEYRRQILFCKQAIRGS